MEPLRLSSVEQGCLRFAPYTLSTDGDTFTKEIKPLSRFDFLIGAMMSSLELIYSTALSAISLFASIASLFQWSASVDWFQASIKDVWILFGTVSSCLLGIAAPRMLNDYLHLPLYETASY